MDACALMIDFTYLYSFWYVMLRMHSVLVDVNFLSDPHTCLVNGNNFPGLFLIPINDWRDTYKWLEVFSVVTGWHMCKHAWFAHHIWILSYKIMGSSYTWTGSNFYFILGFLYCRPAWLTLVFCLDPCHQYHNIQSIYSKCKTHLAAFWKSHLFHAGKYCLPGPLKMAALHTCICQIDMQNG